METLEVAIATKAQGNDNKNTIYEEAYVMNRYAKFQLHTPYGFWGEAFLIFFRKFTLYVAMATN